MGSTVPNAWDDGWVNIADKQEAKASDPEPIPKLSKAQRRAQHQEQQKQLWDQAENPGHNLFLESKGVVPLKDEIKPAVKVLSRKPTPAPKIARKDGTLDDEDDSEEEARKKAELDFEERKRRAKIEREEKQRKYDEARARIMGTASPAPSSRESSHGRANGRRRVTNNESSGASNGYA